MKTRFTGYDDYGFLPGEEKAIKEACRKINVEPRVLISMAAFRANPGIAEDITFSIINGVSYEKICIIRNVPISKVDFYAYRRKCLYYVKEILGAEPSGSE